MHFDPWHRQATCTPRQVNERSLLIAELCIYGAGRAPIGTVAMEQMQVPVHEQTRLKESLSETPLLHSHTTTVL